MMGIEFASDAIILFNTTIFRLNVFALSDGMSVTAINNTGLFGMAAQIISISA